MESMGKKPRRRRSFTPEFKAEIVELCQRGDRSVRPGREGLRPDRDRGAGVGQAGRAGRWDPGGWRPDQRRAPGAGRAAPGEPQAPRGRGHPQAGYGFLREGDPVNVYPFIEAEKQGRRNVKRACELLKVSRAAYYAARDGQPSDRDRAGCRADRADQGGAQAVEGPVRRAADPRGAAPPGPAALPQADRPADAPGRPGRAGAAALEEDHHRRPGGRGPRGRDPPGLHRRRIQDQPAVVRRHHLHRHLGRLALSRDRDRHRLAPRRGIRPGRSPAHRAGG